MRGRKILPKWWWRTTVTLVLFAGIAAIFVYMTYLSYWSALSTREAFDYYARVVSAQRCAAMLEGVQLDQGLQRDDLGPYANALVGALKRVTSGAETVAEEAPHFALPASRQDYIKLDSELLMRKELAQARFDSTIRKNTRTWDLSNATFTLVAILFVAGRLRRKRGSVMPARAEQT